MGGHRLHAHAGRVPPVGWRAGRPARPGPGVRDRRGLVRRGVGRLRAGAERRSCSSRRGRCRASAPRCWRRPAWPSCRRRSGPRTGRGRSGRGPASAVWPRPRVRSSAATSSRSGRGGGCSSSTCRSPRSCCGSCAVTSPNRGIPTRPAHSTSPGAALAVGWLTAITYALIEGPTRGWTSPLVVGCLVVGVVGFGAFLVVERVVPNPMLPLRLFRTRQFSAANAVTFVVYAALGGALVPAPGRAAGGRPATRRCRPA